MNLAFKYYYLYRKCSKVFMFVYTQSKDLLLYRYIQIHISYNTHTVNKIVQSI